MIEIARGPEAALISHCLRRAERGPVVWLCAAGREWRAWAGLRGLLAGLARVRGRVVVDEALRRHAAVAGFAVATALQERTPDERRARDDLAARLTSHLTHNFFLQRPLFDAWGALLAELLGGVDVTVCVPSLQRLDTPSLAAFKALALERGEGLAALVLGWVTDAPAPALDEQGLLWGYPPADLDALALAVASLPGARTFDLPGGDDARPDLAWPEDDPDALLGPAFDDATWRRLGRSADEPWPADARAEAAEALRQAFAGFGFSATLRLGLELERRGVAFEGRDAADAHAAIALAAHNRQFSAGGNRRLADFVERHLRAALQAETRRVERCALAYRLAVTRGRRQGDIEGARAFVAQGLETAAGAGLSPEEAAYQQAWLLNVRAYLDMRAGDVAGAARASEAALERLTAGPGAAPGSAWWREHTVSRAVLASNLASLAHLAGEDAAYARWRRRVAEVTRATPGLGLFASLDLLALHRRRLQPALALEYALEGVAAARAERDAFWEHVHLTHVADLISALGDAAGAAAAWSEAEALRQALGRPGRLRSHAVDVARARLRAGLDDAGTESLRALAAPDRAPAERAESLALLGLRAAESGDAAAAERLVDDAIVAAVESGARAALVAAALGAGRASSLLGRAADARDAYARALDLAQDERRATFPAERFAAALGLAEAATPETRAERTAQALARLRPALDHGDAWWLLPRLLALAAELPPERLRADDTLPALLAAGTQREDCAAGVARLRAALGPEGFDPARAAFDFDA